MTINKNTATAQSTIKVPMLPEHFSVFLCLENIINRLSNNEDLPIHYIVSLRKACDKKDYMSNKYYSITNKTLNSTRALCDGILSPFIGKRIDINTTTNESHKHALIELKSIYTKITDYQRKLRSADVIISKNGNISLYRCATTAAQQNKTPEQCCAQKIVLLKMI